jgi:type IV fimbrial biogenesis protein FimT
MRVDSAPHQQFRSSRRAVAPPLRPVQRGVTLMEVMIVLAIVAIVLAVGVPGFREFVARNRLDGAAQHLLASLQYARSEAMRRGAQVTVRLAAAPGSRNWGGGWTMFVDADGDGVLDDGEKPPVREGAALQAPLTLYGSEGFETLVAFDREGRLTGAGGYFVLCEGDELKQDGHWRSRAVLVNGAGRVRMATRDDGRGVLLTDSGEIGDCGKP